MRVGLLTFLNCILFSLGLCAQGENNNWYFGFGAGLRFDNDGTIEALDNGQTKASEGVSTISGPDGRLLFYTDGGTVWNREHQIMANGEGLFGTEASTQSSVIVPLPGNPDLYYIFTVDATSSTIPPVRGRGLNYSVVDMSMDGGNGSVIEKNTNLLGDCTEKIAVVISECESEVLWIVTFSTATGAPNGVVPPYPFFDTYHAFRMDAAGVAPVSVASTFPFRTQQDQGYLKFSPDGTQLANAMMLDGVLIAEFNKETGVVSNLEPLEITSTTFDIPYGVEFSPNGQFLYVHSFRQRTGIIEYDSALLQFDVNAADISASQVLIEERELYRGALQMGTDGKIYRSLLINFDNGFDGISPIGNGNSYLGVINNPDEKGIACNYEHNAIEISGNRVRQGLPPLVQAFFDETRLAQLGDIVVNDTLAACIGEPLVLEAQLLPGATYAWEKNGIPITTEQNNRIEIASADSEDEGNYTVDITRAYAEDCPVTGEINVTVYDKPTVGDISITVCDIGDENATDGLTEINLDQIFTDSDFTYSFFGSSADLQADIPITDTQAYRTTTPFEETLFYKVSSLGGCEDSGSLTINISEVPELVMDESYIVCTDQTGTIIEGPEGYDLYSWFSVDNGIEELVSQGPVFEVNMQGRYRLEASIVFDNNGISTECPATTEFEVLPSNTAVIDEIIVALFTDNDTSAEIMVSGEGDYEFSMDGTTYQDSNVLENISAGTVTFSVRDKNGCGTVTETVEVEPDLSSPFPEFFTPNSDGTNDTWQVRPAPVGEERDILEIRIFDRYGKFLQRIDPDSEGWNGRYNGTPLPETDYWFVAFKEDGQKIRGHFSLKR